MHFCQKAQDLNTGKGHKENGSSCCWPHAKKAKPKLDHPGVPSTCRLLPDTLLLFPGFGMTVEIGLAPSAGIVDSDGYVDVPCGMSLAGGA